MHILRSPNGRAYGYFFTQHKPAFGGSSQPKSSMVTLDTRLKYGMFGLNSNFRAAISASFSARNLSGLICRAAEAG